MAAVRAGFTLRDVGEYAPDAEFGAHYPRAARYVGWPMLVVLELWAGCDHAARRADRARQQPRDRTSPEIP